MDYNILYNKVLGTLEAVKVPVGAKGAMAFKSKPNLKMEKLWEIFGDNQNIPKDFKIGYEEATSGKGFEHRRITQLNSSSLLAFLCFWNINRNPITINKIEYNQVYFEIENKVFNNPSSVDLFLISSDNTTWLFLESKFTELLNPTNYYWINKKYYQLYQEIVKNDKLSLVISELKNRHKKNGDISIEFKLSNIENQKKYFGGIKQMISHLIGVIQGFSNKDNLDKLKIPNFIILGSILYEFSEKDDINMNLLYQDYKKFYSNIFSNENTKEIIDIISNNKDISVSQDLFKISVLNKPLTYQEIFTDSINEHSLLPKVRKFYNL